MRKSKILIVLLNFLISNPKVIFISNKYRVNNVIVEESNESVGLSADDYKQDDKKEKFITNKSEGQIGQDKQFVPNPFFKQYLLKKRFIL